MALSGKFNVPLDPGTYRLVITRGIEHGHLEREVTVKAGEFAAVTGSLKRLVNTAGWVSTDFHNHSTPSGDNQCGTDDHIINLAAEHIEVRPPPSTTGSTTGRRTSKSSASPNISAPS